MESLKHYFSLNGYPLDISFIILASLSVIFLSHCIPVYSLPSTILFSHNWRQKTGCHSLGDLIVQCSTMPAFKSTRPNISCFITLLLLWCKVYRASSCFSWGLGNAHLPIKEHKLLPRIVPPMMNPVISFFLNVQSVCPAMSSSACLVIHGLWKHAAWGRNKREL